MRATRWMTATLLALAPVEDVVAPGAFATPEQP